MAHQMSAPRQVFMTFLSRMFFVFFSRTLPASSSAKPHCTQQQGTGISQGALPRASESSLTGSVFAETKSMLQACSRCLHACPICMHAAGSCQHGVRGCTLIGWAVFIKNHLHEEDERGGQNQPHRGQVCVELPPACDVHHCRGIAHHCTRARLCCGARGVRHGSGGGLRVCPGLACSGMRVCSGLVCIRAAISMQQMWIYMPVKRISSQRGRSASCEGAKGRQRHLFSAALLDEKLLLCADQDLHGMM